MGRLEDYLDDVQNDEPKINEILEDALDDVKNDEPKINENLENEQSDSREENMFVVKTYVKMRSDLFETYAVIASFFSSIGIAVYYDTVAEEWIPLREEYLLEIGYDVSRTMIEVSKVFACAGILHSILAMTVIVIGLVYMNLFIKLHCTAQFIFNSKVWFF